MKRIPYLIVVLMRWAFIGGAFIGGVSLSLRAQVPKMTVIFVIDQFSAQYLEKMRPYLQGGIAALLEHGIEYTNAFYDASPPSTGHGHALLTTGTYGALHGIISNSWHTKNLSTELCDQDTAEAAAVFAPDGSTLPYGRSAKNMLVDNLSDQLMLNSYSHAHNTVWSLSMKSRASILMAGKLGKAVWLDTATRNYTTSKAYFKSLPQWIRDFNAKVNLGSRKEVTWNSFYPPYDQAYTFNDATNYCFSRTKGKSVLNTTRPIVTKGDFKSVYEKAPQATIDFFKLATACVNATYKDAENERFVLWLNIASLDKVGHTFGPYAKETLDTLYHIDDQIKKFMVFMYTKVTQKAVLFILTGDHGIQPIPEILQKKGYPARRYKDTAIIQKLNNLIQEKYGIKGLIRFFTPPQFYVDMTRLTQVSRDQKRKIMDTAKHSLMSLPGIRKAWTFDELEKAQFEPYDLDQYIKKELYRGRSGHLFYSTDPYTGIYKKDEGASHSTQYAYDTRVPLIFYQPGTFTKKRIHTPRYMTQLSVTLAALLNVPRPSAAVATPLPEILS